MKKKIAIYPFRSKLHSIYAPTLEFLSKNYSLIYHPPKTTKKLGISDQIWSNHCLRYIYHKFIRPIVNIKKITSKDHKEDIPECDLLFCANTLPPSLEKKFIMDLETITAISGYDYDRLDKEKIMQYLSHENCMGVICWNESCKESLIKTIDCSKFMEKIKIIPFAVKSHKIKKDFSRKKLNLLFVSSTNNPFDFERKGGVIALEAYSKLLDRCPDLTFTIRAHVSSSIKRKYGRLKGIKIISEFIPQNELNQILINTDILLEPLPGLNLLLECMDFAIPAISSDFWAIPEMVIPNKNGLTIESSSLFGDKNHMKSYLRSMNINLLKLGINRPPLKIVDGFTEASDKLIRDQKLRRKMSIYAKRLVQKDGIYSIERRNAKLRELIENALKISA